MEGQAGLGPAHPDVVDGVCAHGRRLGPVDVPSSLPHQSILGRQEGAKRASATINGMLPQPNCHHKDSILGCPGDLGSVESVDGSSAGKQMQSVCLLCLAVHLLHPCW